jgi:hypothetical protein
MSTFEDRVNAAASLDIDPRFRALAKLSPDIARQYVIGINPINKENLDQHRPLEGFGGFADHDVDDLIAIAKSHAGSGAIDKNDEEALVIILAAKTPWKGTAKQHLIDSLEKLLKNEQATSSIASSVPQLLALTNQLDFEGRGNNYKGTLFHYTPLEFQLVKALVADGDLGAWTVADLRSYHYLPEGKSGAWGFYDPDSDDIYLIDSLASRDQQCTFVHLAVNAILDFRNAAAMPAKFVAADGYIAQAFVADALGQPYSFKGNRPENVAAAGASSMLQTPLGQRDKDWWTDFKDAYDDVVEAVVRLRGGKESSIVLDMLEDQKEQDRESAVVKKVLAKMKKGSSSSPKASRRTP